MNVRMLANMIKVLVDAWVIKSWDLRGKVSLEEMRQGILELVFKGMRVERKGGRGKRPVKTGRSMR